MNYSFLYLVRIFDRLEDNVRAPNSVKAQNEQPSSGTSSTSKGNYLRDVLGFDLFGSGRKLGDADLSVKFNVDAINFKGRKYERTTKSNHVNTGPTGLLFENTRPPNVITNPIGEINLTLDSSDVSNRLSELAIAGSAVYITASRILPSIPIGLIERTQKFFYTNWPEYGPLPQ